jgi:hypothetical protein
MWDPRAPHSLFSYNEKARRVGGTCEKKINTRPWECEKKNVKLTIVSQAGENGRWSESVEEEKVCISNWNMCFGNACIFIVRLNNCILHDFRDIHRIGVKNKVNEIILRKHFSVLTDFYKYLFLLDTRAWCKESSIRNKCTDWYLLYSKRRSVWFAYESLRFL